MANPILERVNELLKVRKDPDSLAYSLFSNDRFTALFDILADRLYSLYARHTHSSSYNFLILGAARKKPAFSLPLVRPPQIHNVQEMKDRLIKFFISAEWEGNERIRGIGYSFYVKKTQESLDIVNKIVKETLSA